MRLELSGTLGHALVAALCAGIPEGVGDPERVIVHGLGTPAVVGDAPGAVNASIVGPAVDLLEQVAQGRDARVVLVSDLDVLGRAIRLPMDEAHPLAPLDEAAAARASVEHIARAYVARGCDVVIVRGSTVAGPAVGGELATWAGLPAGSPFSLEDAGARVDVVDVRDLAAGILVVALAGVAGHTYHLCSGRAVTRAALFARLAPTCVALPGAATARPPVVIGDATRAEALGWGRAFTLEDTLRAMAASDGASGADP